MKDIIENHWYKKNNFILSILLIPLTWIFFIISNLRKFLYRCNILKQNSLPIPVIVIGNISVGGVGKTPLTKYLATELNNMGIKAGIILRGYKGKNKQPTIVYNDSDCNIVGDEALIYAQNNLPVAIGINRYLAGLKLLEKYPDIQLILSDDGLQHYRLNRDYEIVVVDSTRMFGNEYLLPMGPLRESINRLRDVDAIVINSDNFDLLQFKCSYRIPLNTLISNLTVVFDKVYNPILDKIANLEYFNNKKVLAITAIGNPQRFFSLINNLGINLDKALAFKDHYFFTQNDIPDNYDAILVTEKDYTKLGKFKNNKIWVVNVTAQLNDNHLLTQLNTIRKIYD